MRSKIFFIQCMLCIVVALFTVQVDAAELSNIEFKDQLIQSEHELELKGVGLKYFLFMKAFAAGFYLEEGVDVTNVFDDVARKVDVHYFRNIPGKRLSGFTIARMKHALTKEEMRNIDTEIESMRAKFVDLKVGDRYSLTYIPEEGTYFHHNNELVGTIEGKEFADALFGVWVGEKPFDYNIRKKILGIYKD